jgi:hypothetical protein
MIIRRGGSLGSTLEVSEIESLAKGSLIAGDGSGAPSTLAVGADNSVLCASAAESVGQKWTLTPTLTSIGCPIVIGGTASDSILTLKTTTGAGSSDAIIFSGGNNGATEFGRFDSAGLKLLGGSAIKPATDSVTAIKIAKSDGTVFASFDSTNKRVGVNTSAPSDDLDVTGFARIGDGTRVFRVSQSVGNNSVVIGSFSNHLLEIRSNNATRAALDTNGNFMVGGHITATAFVSLGGGAARTIAMERHTTTNTAGNTLTVQAGGATSGATDKNGGNLILAPGAATGSGSSSVLIQAVAAGGAGTTDRLPATVATFAATGLTLVDAFNVIVGTTTGTKIGVATTQKIGFWNATPIVQPSGANQAALTNNTGGVYDGVLSDMSGFDTVGLDQVRDNFTDIFTLLNEIRTALVNVGIIKGAA